MKSLLDQTILIVFVIGLLIASVFIGIAIFNKSDVESRTLSLERKNLERRMQMSPESYKFEEKSLYEETCFAKFEVPTEFVASSKTTEHLRYDLETSLDRSVLIATYMQEDHSPLNNLLNDNFENHDNLRAITQSYSTTQEGRTFYILQYVNSSYYISDSSFVTITIRYKAREIMNYDKKPLTKDQARKWSKRYIKKYINAVKSNLKRNWETPVEMRPSRIL